MDRNGAEGGFSDAVFNVSNALPQAANDSVFVADWGMYESLEFLHQGRLALHYTAVALAPENPGAGQRRALADMMPIRTDYW